MLQSQSSSRGLYMSRGGESPPSEKPTLHAYAPPLTRQAQLRVCSPPPAFRDFCERRWREPSSLLRSCALVPSLTNCTNSPAF